jgi:hypothetical protein
VPSHRKQNRSPFLSQWRVAKSGYKWVSIEEAQTPTWFLVERCISPFEPYEDRKYSPLDVRPPLYQRFAQLDPTREAILRFTKKYGSLGGNLKKAVDIPEEQAADVVPLTPSTGKPQSPASRAYGESWADWIGEIEKLRQLVSLWEAARAGDMNMLRAALGRELNSTTRQECGLNSSAPTISAQSEASESPFEPIASALYLQRAQQVLSREINSDLRTHGSSVTLTAIYSGFGLSIQAESLIAAIWLQFALAVAGNLSYRSCATCGRWLKLGPEAGVRSHIQFCSNACRQKSFRKRKELISASCAGQ